MNITIKNLRKIIKEELVRVLYEGDDVVDRSDDNSYKVAQAIFEKIKGGGYLDIESEWKGNDADREWLKDPHWIEDYVGTAKSMGIGEGQIDTEVIVDVLMNMMDEEKARLEDEKEDPEDVEYENELDRWSSGDVDDRPNPYGRKPVHPRVKRERDYDRDDW